MREYQISKDHKHEFELVKLNNFQNTFLSSRCKVTNLSVKGACFESIYSRGVLF